MKKLDSVFFVFGLFKFPIRFRIFAYSHSIID